MIVYAMAPRYCLIPVVVQRNACEELKEDENDEPCYGYDADDDGNYSETALGEYAMIEEQDREFGGGDANRKHDSCGKKTIA